MNPFRRSVPSPRAALAAAALLAAALAGLAGPAAVPASAATGGTFSALTYNVAGLPAGLSSSDPATNTPLISPRLSPYTVVHVQEDFNYHAALYAGDDHAHRTPTSGGAGLGSGLNTLSHLPYDTADFERVTWDDCYIGTGDCLTPKGFTFMRVRLEEGTYVDFYNLHADAGSAPADIAARASNLGQLTSFIQSHSAGNAVVVMGDTNTRYTRAGEKIREFAAANGLTDAWVRLVRNGAMPTEGGPALSCDQADVTNDCEVVDKVLYRGSKLVGLTGTRYGNEHRAFLDGAGRPLSDHYPIKVEFAWTRNPDFRLSEQFGGPHGTFYTDVDKVPAGGQVTRLTMRSGSRVDQVGLTLNDGTTLAHGGTGGTASTLALGGGEYITSAYLCQGKKDGRTRIFHARFTTNLSRTLAGGTTTPDCVTRSAPAGWQIAGFHGRTGTEVDKIGFIYTKRG